MKLINISVINVMNICICIQTIRSHVLLFHLHTGFNVGSLSTYDSGIGNSIIDSQCMSQGEDHVK